MALRNYLLSIRNRFKNLLNSYCSNKTKTQIIIDSFVIISFIAAFVSIPLCSFRGSLSLITWALTGLLFILLLVSWIKYYEFHVDVINISLLLFAISSLFSSLINGMAGFNFTPILLALTMALIYSYVKTAKGNKELFLLAIYISNIIFMLIFLFLNRSKIISLNLSRLGAEFGDVNDISIFMGVGFAISFYYVLYKKDIGLKIINFIILALFSVCGLATASRIFIIMVIASSCALIFCFFGAKKWWISLLVFIALIGLGIGIIHLPGFGTVKKRILELIYTMTGWSIEGVTIVDGSTTSRFDMLLCGLEMFLRKPLFGWGIWGFATYGGMNGGWSHNNISESLCNYGLVGSILFHFAPVYAIISFFKNKQKRNVGAYVLLLALLSSMFGVALHTQKVYAYSVGAIIALLTNAKPLLNYQFFNIFKKDIREGDNSKIKIVEVINSLSHRGGAEVFMTSLTNELSKKQCDILLIYQHNLFDSSFEFLKNKEDIQLTSLYKHKGFSLLSNIRYRYIIRKFKPDIIHMHLSCLPTHFFAFGLKKHTWNIFLTQHTDPNIEEGKFDLKLRKKYDALNLIQFVGISQQITDELNKIYKNKALTIYNGFATDSNTKKFDKEYELIIVARMDENKNHILLFKAIEILKLNNYKIKAVCLGDGELLESNREYVSEHKLNDNVVFMGQQNDVYPYLAKSSIFVLSSKYREGNPISILEAMSKGLAIIAPRLGGISDVVKDGYSGILYDADDLDQLVDAIKKLLDDKQLLANISKFNIKESKKYEIGVVANSYLDAFKKTIDGRNNE